ncbi:MAG: tetratricopeptide repeat protein [Pirellulales bacterium]|nr:tetratricopeptide repeat protein [Pirellulales bacterium]
MLTSQDRILSAFRKQVWPRLSAGWGGALILSALLVAVVLVIYGRAWGNEFLEYDDQVYVTRNYNLDRGFTRTQNSSGSGLAWAFTTQTAHNWHPITWLSHLLDVQLFGRDPRWHHGVNVLLHAINSALMFLVWRSLTGRVWPSALVAALFAVHPLNVESVAWVAERKNVLSMFFLLLTLLAYGAYARKGGLARYLLVTLFLALGLMSKSMLVTVPCVLLILDYWPLHRLQFAWTGQQLARSTAPSGGSVTAVEGKESARRIADMRRGAPTRASSSASATAAPVAPPVKRSRTTAVDNAPGAHSKPAGRQPWWWILLEKLPWLAMAAYVSQKTLQAQASLQADYADLPLGARIANALVSDVVYLWQIICPLRLSPMYLHSQAGLARWQPLAGGAMLTAITAVVVWQMRRRPYLPVGWFWYLGTLVPVSGFVQVGLQSRADRYLYLPAIGIFVALAWLLAELVRRWPSTLWPAGLASGAVLMGLSGLTVVQVGYWHDLGTLFGRALEIDPDNSYAHYQLGVSLREKGRNAEAVPHFERARELAPIAVEAQLALVGVLALDGRIAEAEKILDEQLRSDPRSEQCLLNRALVLIEKGDLPLASADCRRVLEDINPESSRAFIYSSVIAARQGKLEEAAEYLDEALRMDPQNAEARLNAGRVAQARGDLPGALKLLREAIAIEPGSALAWYTYGMALAEAKDRPAAIEALEHVVELNPQRAGVHFQLGRMLAEEDRANEALGHFRVALEQTRNTPDWPLVANSAAWLLATHPSSAVRNGPQAVNLAQMACQQTAFGDPSYLDTLAAAYAEAGKFAEAVAYANKAYDVAFDANQLGLAADIKMRWRFYEHQRPYHTQQTPQ